MPNYTIEGKIQTPMTDEEFIEGMKNGYFVQPNHVGFVALLYYSAIRVSEALRTVKEQFIISDRDITFDVKKRLKHGKETPPLHIPLSAPYAEDIVEAVNSTAPGRRIWPYSRVTGWTVCRRVFKYPHFFRLSRITNFFSEGWTIAQVRSWTGLTLQALEFYVGLVDIIKMGEGLGKTLRKDVA